MAYPPQSWTDIRDYNHEDTVEGYTESRDGDPDPGDNRAEGYRWGWLNRQRDRGADDGFDGLRHEYIRRMRELN